MFFKIKAFCIVKFLIQKIIFLAFARFKFLVQNTKSKRGMLNPLILTLIQLMSPASRWFGEAEKLQIQMFSFL